MRLRSYSELEQLDSFDERFDYLKLDGAVGRSTFGFDRHLNQSFYHSFAWQNARELVIIRDHGCDLGITGFEINADILIHHMNPMGPEDVINGEEWITDPEFLITTTKITHNAIHFGNKSSLLLPMRPRTPGDTKLW